MPTAARLVAALLLAGLAHMVSDMIRDLYPEGKAFGFFNYVNALIGFLCGWIVMGPRAGRGWSASISNGITGVAALVIWGLFVQGFYKMWEDSMQNRFSGFMDAIAAIFEFIAEFALELVNAEIIITFCIGAVVIGILTEIAARRWR